MQWSASPNATLHFPAKDVSGPEHEGQAYALTGSELLSFGNVAAILGKVLGKPIRYVDVPESAARAEMIQAGLPEDVVEGLV